MPTEEIKFLQPGEAVAKFHHGDSGYKVLNPELVTADATYPVEIDYDKATVKVVWKPYVTGEEHAETFWAWLQKRGGVAFWQSRALEDCGRDVQTPYLQLDGTPTPAPGWRYNKPRRIIKTADDILVVVAELVKTLPLRRDGEASFAVQEAFKRLPVHSYWTEDLDGDKWVARMYCARHIVPLRDYVDRLVDGKFTLRGGEEHKYTPRR